MSFDKRVIADAKNYPIQPKHINTGCHFFLAFGEGGMEHAARIIVKFCQKQGGWTPFTYKQLEKFSWKFKLDKQFSFHGLDRNDFVILNKDDTYSITHEFIASCFKSSPSSIIKFL